jgi:hypothetical protein
MDRHSSLDALDDLVVRKAKKVHEAKTSHCRIWIGTGTSDNKHTAREENFQ